MWLLVEDPRKRTRGGVRNTHSARIASCKGGDPLPILFAIPKDWELSGGDSMLGLGDIVLPGLLPSFVPRCDERKCLMGLVSGRSRRVAYNARSNRWSNPFCFLCCCCRSGYFGPFMVAYSVRHRILIANAAVYMDMCQLALLYFVPCRLGTMIYMGNKAGEWIRSAEALICGEPQKVDSARRQIKSRNRRSTFHCRWG